jgi:hypothetical protein
MLQNKIQNQDSSHIIVSLQTLIPIVLNSWYVTKGLMSSSRCLFALVLIFLTAPCCF